MTDEVLFGALGGDDDMSTTGSDESTSDEELDDAEDTEDEADKDGEDTEAEETV